MSHQPSRSVSRIEPLVNTAINSLDRTGVTYVRSVSQAPSEARSEASKHTVDSLSEKATAAFIRRTLCAHHVHNTPLAGGDKGRSTPRPIDELLPPLTSSNDVDLQLYAIIAVVIKDFVYSWYAKITPDHVFVDELIQIIAHCTRALEQRSRKVDFESLLLDEIPELVDAHITAYRIAHRPAHPQLASDPRQIYHTLHSHPALSPVPIEADPSSVLEQEQHEAAWRQLLVQGVLAVLLPTEDLENACLRALVGEVFSELLIGNGISGKACEGWLLWEAITRIVELLRPSVVANPSKPKDATSRLEQYGLVASSDEVSDGVAELQKRGSHGANIPSISTLFWMTVQYAFLVYTFMRSVIVALAKSSSLPSRASADAAPPGYHTADRPILRPILSMNIWSCLSHILEVDVRMPWLSGLLSMLQMAAVVGPGKLGGTDGPLDRIDLLTADIFSPRLLSHHIRTTLLDASRVPTLLRAIRAALFPGNTLGPPRIPPTPEEALTTKRRCAEVLLDAVPMFVSTRYFATSEREDMVTEVEEILDVLEDPYLNKHLIFGIVELIVLGLVPEMGEMGVQELMELRLG